MFHKATVWFLEIQSGLQFISTGFSYVLYPEVVISFSGRYSTSWCSVKESKF